MPLDRFERKLRHAGMADPTDNAAMTARGNVPTRARVGFLHVARGKNLFVQDSHGADAIVSRLISPNS